jgi:hypothetical protein
VFRFEINNVICKNCGFVFVSPVSAPTDLAEYYADAYTAFSDQALDYDVEMILALLDKCAPLKSIYVEIGASSRSIFTAA